MLLILGSCIVLCTDMDLDLFLNIQISKHLELSVSPRLNACFNCWWWSRELCNPHWWMHWSPASASWVQGSQSIHHHAQLTFQGYRRASYSTRWLKRKGESEKYPRLLGGRTIDLTYFLSANTNPLLYFVFSKILVLKLIPSPPKKKANQLKLL